MTAEELVMSRYKYIYAGRDIDINRIKIQWHVTDWCNYGCPYCIRTVNSHYASRPKETQEHLESIARLVRPKLTGKRCDIAFFGGEVSHHFDLRSVSEILFSGNDVSGSVLMMTNFSAPLDNYRRFVSIRETVPSVAPRINPSYQWSPIDEFVGKCRWLKDALGNRFYVSVVCWSGTAIGRLRDTVARFADEGIEVRLTHGRVPNSGNRLYDLDPDVLDFVIAHNQSARVRGTCHVVGTDGTDRILKGRSDVLRHIADEQCQGGATFRGMTCITGTSVRSNGDVIAGVCKARNRIRLGNVFGGDFSVEPYVAVCDSPGYCTLCNSLLIWNGKW